MTMLEFILSHPKRPKYVVKEGPYAVCFMETDQELENYISLIEGMGFKKNPFNDCYECEGYPKISILFMEAFITAQELGLNRT